MRGQDSRTRFAGMSTRNVRPRASGTPIESHSPPVYRNVDKVLRKCTPTGLPVSDDDPIFVLEQAVVLTKDGKSFANLLEVTMKGPFIVRGKMVVEPDTMSCLAIPSCKSLYIQVPSCNMFSIGYDPIVLWAWCIGGWLEIRPAQSYRDMYHTMFEGMTLYWEVLAAYQDVEHKMKRKAKSAIHKTLETASLDDIFFFYAQRAGDGVLRSEVEQRCDSHAPFLLDQFDKQLDFDWSRTGFFRWMQERHIDIVTRLERERAKITANVAKTKEQADAVSLEPGFSQQVPKAVPTATGRSRSSRSRSVALMNEKDTPDADTVMSEDPTVVAPPASSIGSPAAEDGAKTTSGFDLLLAILEEIADESGGPFGPTVKHTTFTSKMYFKCKVKDYTVPKEIMRLYAADLLQALDPGRWRGSTLWEWLEVEAAKPRERLHLNSISEILNQLQRRGEGNRKVMSVASASTPARPQARPHMGKTPRLSTARKRPLEDTDLDSSDAEGSINGGGASTPTPGSLLQKRRNQQRRPARSAADADSLDDAGDSAEELNVAGGKTTEVVLRSYPLQTDKPKGPMGTWVCEEDGCGFVVRSADEPERRRLVLEHIQMHNQQDIELAEQARDEGKRNGLPIGHLLEKIMKKASKDKPDKIGGLNVHDRIKHAKLGW